MDIDYLQEKYPEAYEKLRDLSRNNQDELSRKIYEYLCSRLSKVNSYERIDWKTSKGYNDYLKTMWASKGANNYGVYLELKRAKLRTFAAVALTEYRKYEKMAHVIEEEFKENSIAE